MQQAAPVVLVSDSDAAVSIAARLGTKSDAVRAFASVAELIEQQPLDHVGVLVLDGRKLPNGMLLLAMGRMSLDYPALQKVALLDSEPPLPIISYLASRGVDLVCERSGEEAIDELATVVGRVRERTKWIVA